MTPLALFLLACAAVFVGTVSAAFSVLMRLSLRLAVERSGRDDLLGWYLNDPMRLFIPARIVLAVIYVVAGALIARVVAMQAGHGLPTLIAAMAAFALVCEHFVPLLLIRRDPEAVLATLLPAFHNLERLLRPVTLALLRAGRPTAAPSPSTENGQPAALPGVAADAAADGAAPADGDADADADRALLRSIVDFRDTLVREVMTPRPDIVAIDVAASIDALRQLFRDQQYSRVPVFEGTLDNILGFAFVKDLVRHPPDAALTIRELLRPAHFVPETKKVAGLLQEFQRERVQSAIVVDEYGGTAGLVTLEDLLEEIVGEIRDEYDVETEPIVDEGQGAFVVSGRADVSVLEHQFGVTIARAGFDSVGGYLLATLGRVPTKGERVEVDGFAVEVLDAERRRVTRVRVRRHVPADPESPTP
ncbi:MAG: hemolysin family protein [Vicinamibacterales bacterium]